MCAEPSRTGSKGEALAFPEAEVLSMLNQAKYLFLRHISEPQDNSLSIVVEEATIDLYGTELMLDATNPTYEIRKETLPIRSTSKCGTFELLWSRYVAYLVTEEGVGSGGSDEDEVYTGNLLRIYTKSHFLDHLSRDLGGQREPIVHYKLICQNHLIDVASYGPPKIRAAGSFTGDSDTAVKPI